MRTPRLPQLGTGGAGVPGWIYFWVGTIGVHNYALKSVMDIWVCHFVYKGRLEGEGYIGFCD